jgi:DNA topoisomerase VI subunit A
VISSQFQPEHVNSPDDMFDTWAMLEAFCVRELRKNGRTTTFDDLFKQSKHWRNRMAGQGELDRLKRKLHVITYAARIDFGKRLLNLEFRD